MTAQENALLNRIAVRAHGRTPLMDIVCDELAEEFWVDHRGHYYLWTLDSWRPSGFADVMRRFNKRRMQRGLPQILSNPTWEAK